MIFSAFSNGAESRTHTLSIGAASERFERKLISALILWLVIPFGERHATKAETKSGNKAETGSRNAPEATVFFPLLGFYVWPAKGHSTEEASIKKGHKVRVRLYALLPQMVRRAGLEPAHPCGRQDLNLVRLPISPSPRLN